MLSLVQRHWLALKWFGVTSHSEEINILKVYDDGEMKIYDDDDDDDGWMYVYDDDEGMNVYDDDGEMNVYDDDDGWVNVYHDEGEMNERL